MPEAQTQSLVESLCTALETMAFISPMPWEGEAPPAPAQLALASVRCRGTQECFVELLGDAGLGAAIAGNLDPGAGSDIPRPRADDALKEIMNVTAGVLMRGIATPGTGTLALDVPTVEHSVPAERWETFINGADVCLLDVDGMPIAARIRSAA